MNNELAFLIHDLKNELCKIQGLALMMTKSVKDNKLEKLKYYETRLMKKIQEMGEYFNDILEDFTSNEVDLNVKQILDDIAQEFCSNIFKVSVLTTKNFPLKGRKTKLKRVATNIIKNAKEAEAKNVYITIRDKVLEFDDDGKGFPEDILNKFKTKRLESEGTNGFGLKSIQNLSNKLRLETEIQNNSSSIQGGAKVRLTKISR